MMLMAIALKKASKAPETLTKTLLSSPSFLTKFEPIIPSKTFIFSNSNYSMQICNNK